LTSEEHIALRKNKEEEKTLKEGRRKVIQEKNIIRPKNKKTVRKRIIKRKAARCISESSSDLS
jgi:hypothetical protein